MTQSIKNDENTPSADHILKWALPLVLKTKAKSGGMVALRRRRSFTKRWWRRALALGFFFPLSLQVQAAKSVSSPKKETSSSSTTREVVVELGRPARSKIQGQIRMEGMQYLADVPETPELSRSQFLSARITSFGDFDEMPRVSYGVDLAAGTFFKRSQTNYSVQELSMSTRFRGAPVVASVGRKKMQWSELDSRWQTGLWQPRFAIDALRPEEQGLTGLFLDYSGEKFQLLAFATPVFIPTIDSDIREEGGSLKSDSRWFRQPSSQFNFSNRNNSIVYDLDIPEATRLASNPGSALMGRLGDRDDGPWMATAFAYKPVNDLVLRRQAFKVIDQDQIDAVVSPDVAYHSLFSADFGFATENLKASVSYLEDKPRETRPEGDWVLQDLKPVRAYSAQFDWMIPNLFSRTIQMQLGYLRVTGGGIVDIQSNGNPDDLTFFDSRMKFTNAASVGLQGQLASIFRRPLVTKWRYLYDYDQKGSLMNTEFLFYPDRKWAVIMGADLLGVEDETSTASGFLSQYRANDRIYGGMTYVF